MLTLNWQNRNLLSCACDGEVFLGVPAEKTVSGNPWISATIIFVQEVCGLTSGCKEYIYTFEYDETQLSTTITAIDVTDVLCKSLLTDMINHTHTGAFGITIDGDGSPPSTGSAGYVTIPYAGTITHWWLTGDVAGDAVVDLLVNSVSIVGAGTKPTLTAAQHDGLAADFDTVHLAEGTVVEFNLDSIATISRLNLVLKMVKD